ncbi:LOW QUALITY PROTEIN: hypothetical protein M8C21_018246, partial [Ambrosia artemisiifolia]
MYISIQFCAYATFLGLNNEHHGLESFFFYRNPSYLNNKFKNFEHNLYINDTQHTLNNQINSCIENFLYRRTYFGRHHVSCSDSSNNIYISSSICGENAKMRDQIEKENSINLDVTKKIQAFVGSMRKLVKVNICEQCRYHLQISTSNRIELSIEIDTWEPTDEDVVSLDPIELIWKRNIPKIISILNKGRFNRRTIEYTTKEFSPLIMCASKGAHMQKGSLSLMQMNEISFALYDYQSNKRYHMYQSLHLLLLVGGMTIIEPSVYIAFAIERVIKQILNNIVPNDSLWAMITRTLSQV